MLVLIASGTALAIALILTVYALLSSSDKAHKKELDAIAKKFEDTSKANSDRFYENVKNSPK